eukprot:3922962-Pyramimonas_sp.AAC.1
MSLTSSDGRGLLKLPPLAVVSIESFLNETLPMLSLNRDLVRLVFPASASALISEFILESLGELMGEPPSRQRLPLFMAAQMYRTNSHPYVVVRPMECVVAVKYIQFVFPIEKNGLASGSPHEQQNGQRA